MRDIELIAHRGASHDAPENTLASFRLAWETGADGIEGDFRLTLDGEIVCIHDPTTGRTAGADLPVAGSTLAKLRQLDVGSWKGAAWSSERIPTLSEVLATIPTGKRLFIELKCGPEILPPLAVILARSGLNPEQAVILAFDARVVAASRELLPRVKRLWLSDFRRQRTLGGWTPSLEKILLTLKSCGAVGLAALAHHSLDAAFVKALHAAGMEFHVWTVDAPRSAARFVDLGADTIFTNRSGWLRGRLQDMAEH